MAYASPSITALQMLGNLNVIRDNLLQLGKQEVINNLDKYITHLQAGCADDLELLDYITAAIHWVSQALSQDELAGVFHNYRAVSRHNTRYGYVPKAEVDYFCQKIEPKLLTLRET